ncbi:MAG: DUF1439 domain-containing protein [Pseudomonadales bacterium]|nr:DUF1439 domain-containing protein [Pseudomonadales bacterium]
MSKLTHNPNHTDQPSTTLLSKLSQIFRRLLPSYTLSVSAKELEKRLSKKFPVKKKASIFVFKITEPEVFFPSDKSSQIGIRLTLKVSLPGLFAAKGRALIQGEIEYDPKHGAFYFFDPEVQELKIKGLSRRYQVEVKELFSGFIQSALSDMSIFQFNTRDRKQAIAKKLLQSVQVEEGKLKIKFGL